MTSWFTGIGLGAQQSSLPNWIRTGAQGSARLGQGGISFSMNAANGNGVLTQTDGFLADFGAGFQPSQSYNTAGGWRWGLDTTLVCQGVPNTDGSVVMRTNEDGHVLRFVYDAVQGVYRGEDGRSAPLSFTGSTWCYQPVSGRTYEYAAKGQLLGLKDDHGHALRCRYEQGVLVALEDVARGQSMRWQLKNGLVASIELYADGALVHRVEFDYDGAHRLRRVSRDLGHGNVYWIAYDYAGDSTRISDVRQSDGTALHLDYDAIGRIVRLVDGEGHQTRCQYELGYTVITNGLGESWTYYYDEQARLVGVDGPMAFHQRFRYKGDYLEAVTDGTRHWSFQYNNAGDCIRTDGSDGTRIERTYDEAHRCLSEIKHPGERVFWVYEANRLRFAVDSDGVVTEYSYDAAGHRIASRRYDATRWTGLATMAALTTWCSQQPKGLTSLITYRYDVWGQMVEELRYTTLDAMGNGVLTEDAWRRCARYDAAGRPVEESTFGLSGWNTTHYVYDDLGRLIQTIDPQQHLQTIEYDDAHQRIITTGADGRHTCVVMDKNGARLSTYGFDDTTEWGRTTYAYDEASRLIAETNALGQTRHWRYDAAGRLSASVSEGRAMVTYAYDEDGQCVQTRAYAERAGFEAKPSAHDRIHQWVYQHNRLAFDIDATGAVVRYDYNDEGQLVQKTAYANRVSTPFDEGLLNPSDDDRCSHYVYERGRLMAEIDGEGAVVSYAYDEAGRVIETIRHQQRVAWTPDWRLSPARDGDVRSHRLYNALGNLIAEVDALGYLTEYSYDASGFVTREIRYQQACRLPLQGRSLSEWRPPAHPNDHELISRYNALHQCIERRCEREVTTYEYDANGRVIEQQKTDVRGLNARSERFAYDQAGHLMERIGREHLTYDRLGRLVQRQNALNASEQMVYDADGLLAYTIDATGAVTKLQYDAFGQLTASYQYQASNGPLTLEGLDAFSAAHRADKTMLYGYDANGALVSKQLGSGAIQRLRYNAFGELAYTSQALVATEYHYDHRGLVRMRIDDATGAHVTSESTYDAWGYLTEAIDAVGHRVQYTRNARGEVITLHSGSRTETTTYDAFGRILNHRGARNAEYEYDDANGVLTVQSRGTTTITRFNAFGDAVAITDGHGHTTTHQYNAHGQLVQTTYPDGTMKTMRYDAIGQLVLQQETTGLIREWSYDAKGRVLTQTDALQRTTTYRYDALGQMLCVTDAHQTTEFRYDDQGRLLQTVLDPNGLQLTTRLEYNDQGALIRQTRCNPEGLDEVIAYTRDAFGRMRSLTKDPDGLCLTTTYDYDANGQLIQTTDAHHQSERFIYEQGQLRYCIDAMGYVTEHQYDAAGLELCTIRYAKRIDNTTELIAERLRSSADVHHWFRYNAEQQLTTSYDANGFATSYDYDEDGLLLKKTRYDLPVATSALMASETPIPLETPSCRTIRFSYDAAHRIQRTEEGTRVTTWQYDATGQLVTQCLSDGTNSAVTHYRYDAAGRLIRCTSPTGVVTSHRYDAANRCIETRIHALSAADAPISDNDRITRMVYDQAGRECRRETALGVIERRFDALNRCIEETTFGRTHQYTFDALGRLTAEENALHQQTHYHYDAIDQLVSKTDANNATWRYVYNANHQCIEEQSPLVTLANETRSISTQYDYDAFGNRIRIVQDAGHLNQTTLLTYDGAQQLIAKRHLDVAVGIDERLQTTEETYAYNAFGELIRTTDCNGGTTQYVYNTLGQRIESIDAEGNQTHWAYDGLGHLTRETKGTLNNTRDWYFEYDADGRLLARYQTKGSDTRWTYNAFGDVLTESHRLSSTSVATTTHLYNQAGQRTATWSPEHYLSTYDYEQDRLVQETQYAEKTQSMKTPIFKTTDRRTRYTYNALGQLIEQTVQNVQRRIDDPTLFDATTRYHYDALGHCLSTTLANGDTTHLSYNALGKLCARTNAEGTTTTYTYNAEGALLEQRIQNATEGDDVQSRRYDRWGRLTAEIDGNGACTEYRYDACGNRIQRLQRKHRADQSTYLVDQRYTYDRLHRLVQTKLLRENASAITHETAYNAFGEVIHQGTNGQFQVHFDYDALGRLWRSNASGHYQCYHYDDRGRLIETLTADNLHNVDLSTAESWQALDRSQLYSQRIAYDAEDHWIWQSDGTSTQTQVLDGFGNCLQHTNANGYTTDYTYNAMNALLEKRLPAVDAMDEHGVLRVLKPVVRYTLDALNRIIATTDAAGHTTRQVLDSEGHLLEEIDAQGNHRLHHYDQLGNRRQTIDELGHLTQYTYDHEHRLVRIQTPLTTKSQSYDESGQLLSQTSETGHITQYAYDERGLQIQHDTTRYEYDDDGHKIAETDALNHRQTWTYTQGRVASHLDLGGHATYYTYNVNGLLLDEIGTTGKHQIRTYKSNGQLLRFQDLVRQETIEYTEDAEHHITQWRRWRLNQTSTQNRSYDALGRLLHVDQDAMSLTYTYDAVGNVRRTDANGRIKAFDYDANHRLRIMGSWVNGDLQGTTFSYNKSGFLCEMGVYENGLLQHYRYDYNADHQVIGLHKNGLDAERMRYQNGLQVERFLYNNQGHLSRQIRSSYTATGLLSWQDTFNEYGAHVGSSGYTYDAMNHLVHLKLETCTIGSGLWSKEIHDYRYALWDTYQQSLDQMTYSLERYASSSAYTSSYYDANGALNTVIDTPTGTHTTEYDNSAELGLLSRKDRQGQTAFLSVSDKTLGEYKTTLTLYEESLQPMEEHPGSYTVRPGDTLAQIADRVYGDRSLWYLIADANGLQADSTLYAGQRLTYPWVGRVHQTHETHAVLKNQTGDIQPTLYGLMSLSHPTPKHSPFLKTLARIAIAVLSTATLVVGAGFLTALTTGATGLGLGGLIKLGLSTLNGSNGIWQSIGIGFASGSLSQASGQLAAIALNQQQGVRWNDALWSGLATATTATWTHLIQTTKAYEPLQSALKQLSSHAFDAQSALDMATRDAVTQALNHARDRQAFSGTSVAASALTAGLLGSNAIQTLKAPHALTTSVDTLLTATLRGETHLGPIALQSVSDTLTNRLLQSTTNEPPIESTGYCPIPTEEIATPIPDGTWERFHQERAMYQRLEKLAKSMDITRDSVRRNTEQIGESLGIIGDLAYNKTIKLQKSSINQAVEDCRSGQYKIDYTALVVKQAGHAYQANQIAPNSNYKHSPGSPIWGDASFELQVQSIDALMRKSIQHGLSIRDTAHVLAIARYESGFNPYAAAGKTSASGLGQFINQTAAGYQITNANRWDLEMQSDALVKHFLTNKMLAITKNLSEAYIYKFHHDGPYHDFGGLSLSQNHVMPVIDHIVDIIKNSFE